MAAIEDICTNIVTSIILVQSPSHGSRKTCLMQAKFFDTFDGHTCRVHQKMAIAAGEPGIPATSHG